MINWEVEQEPLFDHMGNQIDKHHLLRRSDNAEVLAVHKNSYVPFTNESFNDVCSQLIEITGGELHAYKEFKGGKSMIAKIAPSDSIRKVCGFDMKQMISIVNSHDGSYGLTFGSSSHYYVCSNEFNQIRKGGSSIRHTRSLHSNVTDVMASWYKYKHDLNEMNNKFEHLKTVKIDSKLIESLTNRLFNVENVEEMSTRKSNIITNFNSSLEEELTRHGNNAWGFFNASTNYATHKLKSESLNNVSNRCFELVTSL